MSIAIVPPGDLPVPATRGGAIETLITTIVEHNESRSAPDELTVFSVRDDAASERAEEYRHCRVIFVDGRVDSRSALPRKVFNRLSSRYVGNPFMRDVVGSCDLGAFDAVVIENIPEYGMLTSVPASRQVLHLHNDLFPGALRRLDSVMLRYGRVLTVSEHLRASVQTRLQTSIVGVLPDVRTLHNGIEVERFAGARESMRTRLGVSPEDLVCLFVGRLSPEKGAYELLQAFIRIADDFPTARLVMVGGSRFEGAAANAYTRKLARLARGRRDVHLIGYVDRGALPDIYAAADVGVVPSIWEEPFGLVLLEHMASGLPTIVSRSGGMLEIATQDTSLFVDVDESSTGDLEDALRGLLGGSHLRRSMSLAARERAQHFSAARFVDGFFSELGRG